MKVFENGQLARTETRPFSKSSAASGNAGDFQWFVQAGMAEDPTAQSFGPGQTQKSSSALVGGKLNTGFNTATTFGVAQVRNAHYAESKFDWSLPTRYGNLNTTADFFMALMVAMVIPSRSIGTTGSAPAFIVTTLEIHTARRTLT